MIQVHYARGCTLAEAFYQSVYGPYQLLIVGDPLCRPWADIPQVSVAGVEAGATVRGRLTLEPSVTSAGKATADRFELFVDGVRMADVQAGRNALAGHRRLGRRLSRVARRGHRAAADRIARPADHSRPTGQPRPQDRGVAGRQPAVACRQAADDRRPLARLDRHRGDARQPTSWAA